MGWEMAPSSLGLQEKGRTVRLSGGIPYSDSHIFRELHQAPGAYVSCLSGGRWETCFLVAR